MKILYVTNYQGASVVKQRHIRRTRTLGPARKVELIAQGLASRGHDVHILSAGTVSESTFKWYRGFECCEAECAGARVTYLPGLDVRRVNLLVSSAALRRFFADAPDYDVVFLYNLEWYFLKPTLAFASRRGIPLVIEYEDDAVSDVGVRLKSWHMARGRRAIELARASAAGVVSVSPELQRQLGIQNAIVLPGMVGEDLLSIVRSDARTAGPLRLVYAGGMTADKGPDLLVAATRHLAFPVEVDLVGAGDHLDFVRRSAAQCGGPVHVHGEVSRARLVEILARADIAVNPHRMTDGRLGQIFPYKMVDYVGAGLPVVTSRLGEIPSALEQALVTYFDDTPEALAEAIERAVANMECLVRGARSARVWVGAEYSRGAVAQKAELVFERACARNDDDVGAREVGS